MPEFNQEDIKELKRVFKESKRIIITCHLSPDGDALGSSLGLKSILNSYNPDAFVTIVTPDEPTKALNFLPEFSSVKAYSHFPDLTTRLIEKCDLLICLDFNELTRTDLLAPYLETSKAFKVLIDHHLHPEHFANLIFSYPHKPATCMLLFELIKAMGLTKHVSALGANCILAGILTDTVNLSVNNSDPELFPIIGELIKIGARKDILDKLLFNTHSESYLRIHGFALAEKMQVFREFHAALIILTREELNKYNYRKGDTEGLVNRPLEIPGIIYSCFLREEEGYIKVSMRSVGDFPVNEICSMHFNGGGHLNAAGGEFIGNLEESTALFTSLLELNKEKYIDNKPATYSIIDDKL